MRLTSKPARKACHGSWDEPNSEQCSPFHAGSLHMSLPAKRKGIGSTAPKHRGTLAASRSRAGKPMVKRNTRKPLGTWALHYVLEYCKHPELPI